MIRLTSRRRVTVLAVVAAVLGYWYLSWSVETVENLGRYAFHGTVSCDDSWRDFGTGACSGYHPVLAFVELLTGAAVLALIVWLLVRWTLGPAANMSELVDRLGPSSLGLRLRADGPRDELRMLSDAIDSLLDRVSSGYEAQRRFAANASHELRTPLATQRTLIEVSLSDRQLTPDQVDLLSRQLLMTNERNEKLIEGLLVLAETERGLVGVSDQQLDVLVSEAVAMMRPTAEQAGVQISASTSAAVVRGEQPLLERLLLNLITNAIKYNVADGWVEVSLGSDGLLTVSNTGPMIEPDQVTSLFEPFNRQSGERLNHGGGAGLGLTIVRSIVAAHSGSVNAQARVDGGLEVQVRLPALPAALSSEAG